MGRYRLLKRKMPDGWYRLVDKKFFRKSTVEGPFESLGQATWGLTGRNEFLYFKGHKQTNWISFEELDDGQ